MPRYPRTVGVAPGTLTLRLGGLGEIVAPDPPGWYTTLEYLPEYTPPAAPAMSGPKTWYDPYQDIASLKGVNKLPGIGTPPGTVRVWQGNPTTMGKIAARLRARQILNNGTPLGDDTQANIRWDLILGVSGVSLIIAMLAGVLAAR